MLASTSTSSTVSPTDPAAVVVLVDSLGRRRSPGLHSKFGYEPRIDGAPVMVTRLSQNRARLRSVSGASLDGCADAELPRRSKSHPDD